MTQAKILGARLRAQASFPVLFLLAACLLFASCGPRTPRPAEFNQALTKARANKIDEATLNSIELVRAVFIMLSRSTGSLIKGSSYHRVIAPRTAGMLQLDCARFTTRIPNSGRNGGEGGIRTRGTV